MASFVDLSGRTFGDWTVVEYAGTAYTSSGKPCGSTWHCRCGRCSEVYRVKAGTLVNGSSTKCLRCRRKENPACRLRPYEAIYNYGRRIARRIGCIWTIPYEAYAAMLGEAPVCHYCLIAVEVARHNPHDRAGRHYRLDRKDAATGYVADNVVVCCERCNFGKTNRFTYD